MTVDLILDSSYRYGSFPKTPCGVVVPLVAGADSLLQWDRERQKARELVGQGYQLLWELQLGLFSSLAFPIGDQMQFHSLQLALRHFFATLWQEWSQDSVGVIVWRGEAGVWPQRLWNEEEELSFQDWGKEKGSDRSDYILQRQFDYLRRLTEGTEETAPLYVALSLQVSLQKEISWLHPARVAPFVLALTPQQLPWGGMHWDREEGVFRTYTTSQHTLGVCLPPLETPCDANYLQALSDLNKNKKSFRLLSEETLLQDLEGLDQILYCLKNITQEGERKLQGFAAAGGELICIKNNKI